MAKTTIDRVKIIEKVTLELTPEEFEFLFRLIGNHIGGMGPWRVLSDNIYRSILDADPEITGIDWTKRNDGYGPLPIAHGAYTSLQLI